MYILYRCRETCVLVYLHTLFERPLCAGHLQARTRFMTGTENARREEIGLYCFGRLEAILEFVSLHLFSTTMVISESVSHDSSSIARILTSSRVGPGSGTHIAYPPGVCSSFITVCLSLLLVRAMCGAWLTAWTFRLYLHLHFRWYFHISSPTIIIVVVS